MYAHHQNHSLGSISGEGTGCQSSVLGAGAGTTLGNQSAIHHQLTLHKVGTQLRHHLSPALSLSSTLSSNQQQKYQPQQLSAVPSELLVTASGAATSNSEGGPINHLKNISATLFNRNPGHHQSNVRTKTLYCGGGDLHNSNIDNFVNVGRLPNHYIPELTSGSFTLGHNLQQNPRMLVINNGENGNPVVAGKRHMVIEDFRQRFGDPTAQTRNVMELSERPPMLTPTSVNQPSFPPHILIGGQPFYLVPTSSAATGINNCPNDTLGEQYTYPQNIHQMPIYEEIDSNNSRVYAAAMGGDVVTNSDFEYYCAQPGPESTSEVRMSSNNDPQASRFARVQMGEPISRNTQLPGSREQHGNMQHLPVGASTGNSARPVSSSTSNSQHTNTSELSSNSSNDGNISGIQHPLQQQSQQQQQHHVVVNPLSSALSQEDIKNGKFLIMADTSFSSDYVNSSNNSAGDLQLHTKQPSYQNNQFHPSPKYPPRLADGFERCRSPQSIYSAKLAIKAAQQRSSPSSGSTSGNSSGCGSKGSSVYYYSDTLRKPEVAKQQTRGQIFGNKMFDNETSSDHQQQPIASPRFLNSATNASTSDESDSGIGAKFECSPSTISKDGNSRGRKNNFDFINSDFAGSDCSSSTPQHIPSISSQTTHTMSPGPAVSTKVVLDDHHSSKKSALV